MFTLRQWRAALVIATVWGIAWAALGLQAALSHVPELLRMTGGDLGFVFRKFLPMASATNVVLGFAKGAACGLAFAVLLRSRERGRGLRTLRYRRVLTWGIAAGLLWSLGVTALTPELFATESWVGALWFRLTRTFGTSLTTGVLAVLSVWCARRMLPEEQSSTASDWRVLDGGRLVAGLVGAPNHPAALPRPSAVRERAP